jgi:hypothetical protein
VLARYARNRRLADAVHQCRCRSSTNWHGPLATSSWMSIVRGIWCEPFSAPGGPASSASGMRFRRGRT